MPTYNEFLLNNSYFSRIFLPEKFYCLQADARQAVAARAERRPLGRLIMFSRKKLICILETFVALSPILYNIDAKFSNLLAI